MLGSPLRFEKHLSHTSHIPSCLIKISCIRHSRRKTAEKLRFDDDELSRPLCQPCVSQCSITYDHVTNNSVCVGSSPQKADPAYDGGRIEWDEVLRRTIERRQQSAKNVPPESGEKTSLVLIPVTGISSAATGAPS